MSQNERHVLVFIAINLISIPIFLGFLLGPLFPCPLWGVPVVPKDSTRLRTSLQPSSVVWERFAKVPLQRPMQC